MNRRGVSMLLGGLLIAGSLSIAPQAMAEEKWTITERQEALNSEITAKEKAGELTAAEADKFRSCSKKVTSKIDKMKTKNEGKLSYANITTIEKDLNKLSTDIHKKCLEKRVK